MWETNDFFAQTLDFLPIHHFEKYLGPEFFQNSLSYRMRNRPMLTTVLRRVGEFNTSLIACLKLSKKLIITRSRQEKKTLSQIRNLAPSGPSNTYLYHLVQTSPLKHKKNM